jgi:hypothetical protein
MTEKISVTKQETRSGRRLRRSLVAGATATFALSAAQLASAAWAPGDFASACSEDYYHCWDQSAFECAAAYCGQPSVNNCGTCTMQGGSNWSPNFYTCASSCVSTWFSCISDAENEFYSSWC